MAQIAIAWVLSRPGVTAPIVGTTSLKNLENIIGTLGVQMSSIFCANAIHSLGGVHVNLTNEETKTLEDGYKPQTVLGHF